MLFLDWGSRFQAPKVLSNNIGEDDDTSTKIGRDRQFDMLKRVRCRPNFKIAPIAIFRLG